MKIPKLLCPLTFLIPLIMGWFLLLDATAEDRGRLLPKEIEFINNDELYMTPEERVLWHERMRTESGITPILFEQMMLGFEVKNDGVLKLAGYALRFRTDMTAEQLQSMKSKMRELSSKDIKQNTAADYWMAIHFLSSTVRVLANYPSSENEELALSILEGQTEFLVQLNAALTLGSIGTKKSLATVKKFTEKQGETISSYPGLLEAPQKIEERIRSGGSSKPPIQTNEK